MLMSLETGPGRLKKRVKNFLFPHGRPWAVTKVWSIGIYKGASPLQLTAPDSFRNPVITAYDVSDVPAMMVADPFMLRKDQTWYMFFEVLNNRTGRGQIGLAISRDGDAWSYQQIVLAEPFHVSYPYVFEHENEMYMIPESYQANSVRLYRARRFPTDWAFVRNLLEGGYFFDSSVVLHEGQWWMFTETGQDFKSNTLRLFYADKLTGPWLEHPKSPIVSGDPHIARPAGRLIALNDKLIRYTQDDYPKYGRCVRAFEVIELTMHSYRERLAFPSPIVEPAGHGWNRLGMHHVDPHAVEDGFWLACVDGLGLERPLVSRSLRRIERLLGLSRKTLPAAAVQG
jgi:hypothetical protein